MSNPTPGDGGDETVNVASTLANAPFTVTAYYKTTTHKFDPASATNSAGSGSFTFSIGRPTPGYTVRVTVSFGGGTSCDTSFTPQ